MNFLLLFILPRSRSSASAIRLSWLAIMFVRFLMVLKCLKLRYHYTPEIREIPRIDKLNEYLENEMIRIKEKAQILREEKRSWKKLNEMFLEEV